MFRLPTNLSNMEDSNAVVAWSEVQMIQILLTF